MKLDYGTQISPVPIELSCGTLKKPTLMDIATLGFNRYDYYRYLLKLTPEVFFTGNPDEKLKNYWESLSPEDKDNMTLMNLIASDPDLQSIYTCVLSFFFVEFVAYNDGLFILFKQKPEKAEELTDDNFRGVITKETLPQILNLIQQICCISDPEEEELPHFKNKTALKLFKQMQKSKREIKSKEKSNIDFAIPNIISSLSNKHPSLNYINIWNLTVFQLYDAFSRVQTNSMFDIDSRRVSVWGDEKKTFDFSLWYKNEYDKK